MVIFGKFFIFFPHWGKAVSAVSTSGKQQQQQRQPHGSVAVQSLSLVLDLITL